MEGSGFWNGRVRCRASAAYIGFSHNRDVVETAEAEAVRGIKTLAPLGK